MSCGANCPMTLRRAVALSFAKLFVDQALPTGGVAGTLLATSALERQGVSKRRIAGTVILERATFLTAYALALLLALGIAWRHQHFNDAVVVMALIFATVALGVASALVMFAGHTEPTPLWVRRARPVAAFLGVLKRAEPATVRQPRMFLRALLLQGTVITLDTATMVVVMRALGATVPFSGVFASFMISSLFRTISIVPGGLGPFEASSVLTLRMMGAPVAVAASATLLFRVLSYWLPMVPGLWFARHAITPRGRWSTAYA
jgi:Mg2+-importing ATPase